MKPVLRTLEAEIEAYLDQVPAVGILGPRQVGKSTLARSIGAKRDAVYLDLQTIEARAQLEDPTLFLRANQDRLVVIDEIQRQPELFSTLRPLIDEHRRPGRFLILGSASPALMPQANESLAGRIAYEELTPLTRAETSTAEVPLATHWLQGGYPEPLLQLSGKPQRTWRSNYLTTFVSRDLRELGIQTNEPEFERLLSLLAHLHGGIFNASELARSLRISAPTVQRYLDILTQAFLVRTLQPYFQNIGKRLVKSPKVYWRDSGLRHALLGIYDHNELLLHPALGSSWEGYALEEICRAYGDEAKPYFYRTQDGSELDLVLEFGTTRRLAFEFKFSAGPTVTKGTYLAIEAVQPTHTYIVTPSGSSYPKAQAVTTISLDELLAHLPQP